MSILQMLFHREVDYATSGGTKLEPGNGYLYHVFTDTQSAQNFTLAKIPNETVNIDYIVIAGGGGGGATRSEPTNQSTYGSGGGGAGGVLTGTSSLSLGTYTIRCGSGGSGGIDGGGSAGRGSDGTPSYITGIATATGGGGGGYGTWSGPESTSYGPGNPGGSGGGGAAPAKSKGTGISGVIVTGDIISGFSTVTGIGNTAGFSMGDLDVYLSGLNIPSGTTITSIGTTYSYFVGTSDGTNNHILGIANTSILDTGSEVFTLDNISRGTINTIGINSLTIASSSTLPSGTDVVYYSDNLSNSVEISQVSTGTTFRESYQVGGEGNPGGQAIFSGNVSAGGGGGSGGNGGNNTTGGVANTYPNYSSTIIAPAIPSTHRPNWSPVVGSNGYYASGGNGGSSTSSGYITTLGGAGTNSAYLNKDGKHHTGGGGGGHLGRFGYSGSDGGSGGHGLVIIRIDIS